MRFVFIYNPHIKSKRFWHITVCSPYMERYKLSVGVRLVRRPHSFPVCAVRNARCNCAFAALPVHLLICESCLPTKLKYTVCWLSNGLIFFNSINWMFPVTAFCTMPVEVPMSVIRNYMTSKTGPKVRFPWLWKLLHAQCCHTSSKNWVFLLLCNSTD